MAPSDNLMASPGTSSEAGSLAHSLSRRTSAVGVSLFLRTASAAPARPSWTNPSVALKRRRAPIIAASTCAPSPISRARVASSIHGTGAQNFSRKTRQRGGTFSLTVFKPNSLSRRRASALVRPTGAMAVAECSWASALASRPMSTFPTARGKMFPSPSHMTHLRRYMFDVHQSVYAISRTVHLNAWFKSHASRTPAILSRRATIGFTSSITEVGRIIGLSSETRSQRTSRSPYSVTKSFVI